MLGVIDLLQEERNEDAAAALRAPEGNEPN
jgi:hypothetical protein